MPAATPSPPASPRAPSAGRAYLDHNATTPLAAEAAEALLRALDDTWANPSSQHAAGQASRRLLECSRVDVATLLGAKPGEIVFTGSGTEACNQVLLTLLVRAGRPGHVITSAVEHAAVLRPCARLAAAGWRVTHLPVDGSGRVDPAAVAAAIAPDTALVSIMLANNETGVLQPVREIAALARARGIPVHTDAVQALGRIPVDVRELGVDFLAASAHKCHGPKGVGLLYVRQDCALPPLLHGGGQEQGRRAGTENVAGIAGFAAACVVAGTRLAADAARLLRLRERLEQGFRDLCPRVHINGTAAPRLPNTVCASFPGVDGHELVANLNLLGVCVSAGAACSSGQRRPSHVLAAMGCRAAEGRGAVRFSLGHGNTDEDIERVLLALRRALPARARR